MAEAETIRKLRATLDKLREQRDLLVARYDTRLTRLRKLLANLADEKALLIKQRDEEISELEEELKRVGGVAG
jgi:hypothetical protein